MTANELKLYLQANIEKFNSLKNLKGTLNLINSIDIVLAKKSFMIYCACKEISNFQIQYSYKELINKITNEKSLDKFCLQLEKEIETTYKCKLNNYNIAIETKNLSFITEKIRPDVKKSICEYQCSFDNIKLLPNNNLMWNNILLDAVTINREIIKKYTPKKTLTENGTYSLDYDDDTYNQIVEELKEDYISKLKTKLLKTTNNKNQEIYEQYKEIIDLFKAHSYPQLNGIKKQDYNIECFCMFEKPNYYIYKTPLGNIEYNDGKIIKKFTKKTNDCLMFLNNKKYISAEKHVLEKFNSYEDLSFSTDNPLFLRNCIITIKNNSKLEKSYNYEFIHYTKSVTEFKNEFNKYLNSIVKDFKAFENKQNEENIKKYSKLFENFIYEDIINFVKENENYITANATAQALRGLKVQLNTDIHKTKNCGKYNYYSSEEIIDFIDDLSHKDFLYKKDVKGTYGHFDLLKIGKNKIEPVEFEYKITDLNKKFKSNIVFSDKEALFYFNKLKDEKTNDNYIKLLHLIYTKGFMCLYMNEYLEVMKDLPEEIKSFIKMKEKLETDKLVKKLLKELIKKK